ncbi:CPBP family intramembrane glutamic endopeptidase [Ktedonosporobacter rubrisoli]|nr:CPBP family intramembrane glutamic endopeptidase [Ktedonosporobacter rubrisoli]
MQGSRSGKVAIWFGVLILGCTLGTDLLGLAAGSEDLMYLGALWALILTLIFTLLPPQRREYLRMLRMHHPGKLRWYCSALLISGGPVIVSFLVAWSMHLVEAPACPQLSCFLGTSGAPAFSSLTSNLLLYLPFLFLFALFEEMAWRGFLQPRLSRWLGLKSALLITGLIWGLWHYGWFIWGHYYPGGELIIDMLMFTLDTVLESVIMGWILLRGESLWPLVLYHGASNSIWELCNAYFRIKHAGWVYLAGESSIINLVIWGIIVVFLWRRLPRSERQVEAMA